MSRWLQGPRELAVAGGAAAMLSVMGLLGVVAVVAGASEDERGLVDGRGAAREAAGGDGNSRGAAISASGRYVAFWSVANNLAPNSHAFRRRVFVRDRDAEKTVLASRQSSASGGAGANGNSDDVALSLNGRFVAFRSGADNLSGLDKNVDDVFVRDRKTNKTVLVSRQSEAAGGAGANGFSSDPAVSADGRFVAFTSSASNLDRRARDGERQVFLRDRKTKKTELVSRQSTADGGAVANRFSSGPSVSADGRYVAFWSAADNLSDDARTWSNVFVRDMKTGKTILVSRHSAADGGVGGHGFSYHTALSAEGRYVAFVSDADNLSDADNNRTPEVFVRDLKTETTVLVSRQSAADGGAPADGRSTFPAISADGRHVAFQSDADKLSDLDENAVRNVFVRDLAANTTTLVSRASAADGGVGGNGDSYVPSVSEHGRFVAFWSYAANLSQADDDRTSFGPVADVFVRDLKTQRTTLVSRQSAH
jgi:Tol biopolymer transport system component